MKITKRINLFLIGLLALASFGVAADSHVDERLKFSYYDELRTVERTSIFQYKSIYGVSALRDIVTGTVNQTDGEYTLENAGNGDVTQLDTAERGPYASGFTGEPGLGMRLPSVPTGNTKVEAGYFGDDDGWFFRYTAEGLYTVIRRAGAEAANLIARWNADGELFWDNRNVKTFDPTDGFIYQIPYSWYAFGPTTWEYQIRSINDANPIWMQSLSQSRPTGQTSVTDPQQPVRIRVETGAGDPAYTVYVGGRQYSIVGDYDPIYRETSIETTVVGVDDTAWYPAFAIRRASITPYALTQLNNLAIRATGDVRILIENNGNTPAGSFVTPADYIAGETLLEVNTAPGSTQGTGDAITLQKLHFEAGTPSNPSGPDKAIERFPLIEAQPLIVYVRRFAGEGTSIDVDVLATFREDY